MKKLLTYLSPFAPDISGACAVLFEMGGITVICDAGGCTGNVCGFDEPRWGKKPSALFSAGLRDMDAILGRDDRLAEKLAKAVQQRGAPVTAIVGTPVPAVPDDPPEHADLIAVHELGIAVNIAVRHDEYLGAGIFKVA